MQNSNYGQPPLGPTDPYYKDPMPMPNSFYHPGIPQQQQQNSYYPVFSESQIPSIPVNPFPTNPYPSNYPGNQPMPLNPFPTNPYQMNYPGNQPIPNFLYQYPPQASIPPTYSQDYQQFQPQDLFQEQSFSAPSLPAGPSMPIQPPPPQPQNKQRIIIGVPNDLFFNGFSCSICKKSFGLGKSFWHSEGSTLCEKCHFRSPIDDTFQHFSGLAKSIPSDFSHLKKEPINCQKCGAQDLVFFFKDDSAPYWVCQQCYEHPTPSDNSFSFIDKKNSNGEESFEEIVLPSKIPTHGDKVAQNLVNAASQFFNQIFDLNSKPSFPLFSPNQWPIPASPIAKIPDIKSFSGTLPKQSYENGFRCDKCASQFPKGIPFYHNHAPALKDYDLCCACFKNLNPYTFEHAKYLDQFKCYTGEPERQHPNSYAKMNGPVSVNCDGCGAPGLTEFFHKQGCPDPNIDYCKKCFFKNPTPIANEFVFHKPEIAHGIPKQAYNDGFGCNTCGATYSASNPFYHCHTCGNFDMCLKCHAKKTHDHDLILYTSNPKEWSSSTVNCDRCGKQGLHTFFHKSNTDYDLCEDCFPIRNMSDRNSDFVYGNSQSIVPPSVSGIMMR